MPSKWIEFIKQWAKDNNTTYGCAMSQPECKNDYHKKYNTPKYQKYMKKNLVNQTKKRKPNLKEYKTKKPTHNKTKRDRSTATKSTLATQGLTNEQINKILEPYESNDKITDNQKRIAREKLQNLKFENTEDFKSLWGEKPNTLFLQGKVRAEEWFKDGSENPNMWPTSNDY